MVALLALAARLATLGAGALGISLPAFALFAGLALGSGPAGYAGYRVGHALGWNAGAASADRTAELNRLARDLAEVRLDAANERTAAAGAREALDRGAAALTQARKRNDAYARELAARGPLGGCGLTDADRDRLRGNAWLVEPGAHRPHTPARR